MTRWNKMCPLNSSPEKAIYCVGKGCAFYNEKLINCSIPLIADTLLEIKKMLEKTENMEKCDLEGEINAEK